MTMRLTNQIKQQIVIAAIAKAGIPAEEEALRQRREAWAEAVRVDALGSELAGKIETVTKQVREALAVIPESLRSGGVGIVHRKEMYVNVAGVTAYAYFNGHISGKGVAVSKPAIHSHTLQAGNPLVEEFYEIDNARIDLDKKAISIEKNVIAALANIHTDTRLLKVWPEAAELLPAEIKKVQLPALPTADLNALIGLPSEKEAA
ncbi:hypothetical protein ATO50_00455 [Aeromonas hydrophila]|nr:hypothetical protein ATO50_00455 [Aeromonas hydrophila]